MPDHKKPTMFPRDCPRDCPHFRAWDMSIDDWTCVCDLLHCQIDECDTDYQQARCPLDDASDRLSKICADHGLTPEGVEFALSQYQKVICEITHGMLSKLTYEADHVLEVAQERWCNTCELKEAQEPMPCGEKIKAGDVMLDFYECGYCKNAIRKPWKYCPFCGKAVKWE